jgi:histidinol-phosphate aminotransferase
MIKKIKAKQYIEEITPYKQGVSKIKDGLMEVIKLSSNENALGSSPKAIKAYKDHSERLNRYADGSCFELRQAIAGKYNINPDRIVCGAGSDEIISLLIQAFAGEGDEIIYSQYGFLMYPISAQKFGVKTIAAKETNLVADIDNIVDSIGLNTKMIFIANPNNPTGSYLNNDKIQKLIDKVPKNIIIILDLAYDEFVDKNNKGYVDATKLVQENENIVMIRTFSKIYGLASLRLGWSYSSDYIGEVLNKNRGPFNVTGAAMESGIAAIKDDKFIQDSIAHNNFWLKKIKDQLQKIGLKTHPSMANFILIDFLNRDNCQKANQFLLQNGVILRDLSSYKLENCLRMTIGTEYENLKVIELLKEFQNLGQ